MRKKSTHQDNFKALERSSNKCEQSTADNINEKNALSSSENNATTD